MQQLASTSSSTFSSARYSDMNTSAPLGGSTGNRQASQVSMSSSSFSRTSGHYAAFDEGFERSQSSNDASFDTGARCDKAGNASGKGCLNSAGSALIGGVSKCNDFFNSPAIAAVGQTCDKLGICGKACHFLCDLCGYGVSKAVAGIGQAMGGEGSPNYHFEQEWLGGGASAAKA